VLYPALPFTKLDLARYYEAVAGWMLPHVVDRPLTLVHCPQGVGGECRYLRHGKAWGPSALRRVSIREQTKTGQYLVIDNAQGLIALAQMDILEIHTWNTRTKSIERPDRLVFDLDPGPAVRWPAVVAAAKLVRSALEALDLESWVKTTGGAGLHVVVPLVPQRNWEECLAFARGLAHRIEQHDPKQFTTKFGKAGREAQILVDYLRNNRTNTSVAAFSTRANADATVSMPLRWDELRSNLRASRFTVQTVPRALARRRDPWQQFWKAKQRLSDAALRAV